MEKAEKYLKTQFIGKNIIYKSEAVSTNQDIKQAAASGAPEGTVVIAQRQTAGRGRRGHTWYSKSGGLYMSVLLKPNISPEKASQITLLTGIAVCRAVSSLTGVEAGIKWPNDVVVSGKKISGILIEASIESSKVEYLAAGIGININNFIDAEISEKGCSLYTLTNKEYDINMAAAAVLNSLEPLYKSFVSYGGIQPLLSEYSRMCVTIGKRVKAYDNGTVIEAEAVGIGDSGELLLKNNDGKISIISGEVTLRTAKGEYA